MRKICALGFFILLTSCSGGSGSSGGQDGGCDGSCGNVNILSSEVRSIMRRAVVAAEKQGVSITAALVDRTGHVLAVYQMPGAPTSTTITAQIGAVGGLEGSVVPSTLAAISKAGTGAYLSSQGNAFSTRTAGQIIQENFLPGEQRQVGGPLFGVQFSQLPCSDLMNSNVNGPKPLPLGLSADPGGIPLYKNGDMVGGLGIESDGLYTIDRNIHDIDSNVEEEIAVEAAFEFQAPENRTGNAIFVGGKTLRFSDSLYPSTDPLSPGDADLVESNFVAVPAFFSGSVRDGTVFGTGDSGVVKTVRAGSAAATLASLGNATQNGTSLGGAELSATEVSALLDSVLLTADRTRAAIRRPQDTRARVSIFVVDHTGKILGFVRSEDAPVFGIDVSLQKARTAAFFSSAGASAKLAAFGGSAKYVGATTSFAGRDLFNGSIALGNRGVGNLSRPFYPDGINGNSNGPLSLPFPGSGSPSWSPFNVGLQLDLILARVVAPLSGSIPSTCTDTGVFGRSLANGMQIFPGSVPIYRNGTLVGAVGISGDGVDQDDLIAFYGASRRGLDFAGHTEIGDPILGFNAPSEIRSDTVEIPGTQTRLRYVNCPEAPFVEDNDQNICE